MKETLRAVRSILCVPGHQAAMVASARQRGADLVLFDLEDSVPPAYKQLAREAVAAVVTLVDAVRINAAGSADYERDRAALAGRAGLVAVPKVRPGDIHLVASEFGASVAAVIESAAAVRGLDRMVAVEEPAALIFGYADFMADCRLVDPESPLIRHAWLEVVLAAAAAGIPAFDSPCTVASPKALARSSSAARSAGYAGMICIHPRQVAAVNAAFSLSEAEARYGEQLLAESAARGGEVFELDGKMVATPMVKLWQRVLA